ncbi:MAG TPA: DUF5134 domain-containing protein [Acidimicrobiales bacterium]
MSPPTWLVDSLAGLMLATSGYCVARLVAARAWKRTINRDTNIAHTADAVAMAGMLVGALKTLPDGVWEIVFAFFTLWFAARAARAFHRHGFGGFDGGHEHLVSHYLSHFTMAGAMLSMFVQAGPSTAGSSSGVMSAMGGGGTSNLSELTLLMVIILFGSAVWHADSLTIYTTARRALVGAGAPLANGWPDSSAGGAHISPSFDAVHRGPETSGTPRLAPRLETACHIALCITMGYMLILLL